MEHTELLQENIEPCVSNSDFLTLHNMSMLHDIEYANYWM